MKNTKTLFLILGILTGCTATELQFNQTNLKKMIGQPETTLIQKLGQPDKNITEGATTYLIYTTTYENYTPPVAQPYQMPGALQTIMGYYTPQTCVTVFEIKKSIIQSVHTIGPCL